MNTKQLESLLVLSKEFASLELSNYILADTLLKLKKLSKTIDKYNVIACERTLTESEAKAQDRAEAKAHKIGEEVLKCKVYICSDARGLPIGLYLPSGRYNSFDGETWRKDY